MAGATSRLIVAIDPERREGLGSVLAKSSMICSEVYGLKIGLPFMMLYGLQGLSLLRDRCKSRIIADFKLADVGHVMVRSLEPIVDLIDVVIAHSFIGIEGSLSDLKRYLDSKGIDLALVVSMSHPGSVEVMDSTLDRLLSIAEKLNPWGIVAPATRPHIIKLVRGRISGVKILSPGVGAQGARPGDALRAGADYEIVGRAIWESENPLEIVRLINLEHRRIIGGT